MYRIGGDDKRWGNGEERFEGERDWKKFGKERKSNREEPSEMSTSRILTRIWKIGRTKPWRAKHANQGAMQGVKRVRNVALHLSCIYSSIFRTSRYLVVKLLNNIRLHHFSRLWEVRLGRCNRFINHPHSVSAAYSILHWKINHIFLFQQSLSAGG